MKQEINPPGTRPPGVVQGLCIVNEASAHVSSLQKHLKKN